MAWYKEFDPTKALEVDKGIPQSLLDFPQIIAEKQARKLFGRGIVINAEDENVLNFLNEFIEVNRLHEQLITIEELCSLFGQVIITLDKYPNSVPRIAYADPYMLSRVGKFHITEKSASVFKYIVRDTKTYPVYEEWTEKKVKRIWYLPDTDVQVDSLKAPVTELKGKSIYRVEEKNHNLGCLPVVELRNKQKWVYEIMSPWSWKPQLATWYPVRGMIQFAYHTLRQIWKNMILVKPKIVGEFQAPDMKRYINKPSEMLELFQDTFITLKGSSAVGEKSNLSIIQGEMNIRDWFEGFQQIYNHILLNCGFSPDNQSETMKTTSEIYANQSTSKESINLLKQLRIDQLTRIFDKALIIGKVWNGSEERPYTISIPDEENMNQALAIKEAKEKIEANLSNYITETARIYGVSKHEAERIMEENVKINQLFFDKTESIRVEHNRVEKSGVEDDK